MPDISFEFAEKSKKLDEIKLRTFNVLEGNKQYQSIKERIQADLKERGKESKLCITFVGQYSAGKSTIISALTGDENIKIDSDISTDSTTKYPWRDVLLVDTPGLYTHHPEHDAVTEEAIKQADILVYCLTYSLFDNLLLKDFQRLAYERGYASKMFLVINKMDGEFGLYEELVGNYKKSLAKDLGEGKLEKFSLNFVVAQWQRDSDPAVREESHFNDFILHLNNFINTNGQMVKILGSANIFIDNIQQGIIENNDSENKEFFQIIDRIEREFKKQERECDSFFLSLVDDLHSKIINAGYQFINLKPEAQAEADENCKKIELQMEQYCALALKSLEDKFTSIQEALNNALLEIAESELVSNFYASEKLRIKRVEHDGVFSANNTSNIEMLNSFLPTIKGGAVQVANAAVGAKAGGAGMFLTSSGASGSALHQTVLSAGHFFGYSFKPWQAVNIAKNIGNFAKILGPLAIAFSIGMEVYDSYKEKQQAKKEQESRRKALSTFSEQANSVVDQFRKQYADYKGQTIDKNLKKIKITRDQRTEQINLTDKTANELKSCVEDLKQLIS